MAECSFLIEMLARARWELGRTMAEGQYDDATRSLGRRIMATCDRQLPPRPENPQ